MSQKIVAFQCTTGAYTSAPDSAFFTVSEHTSESAAEKARRDDRAEMHRNCGQNAWSHNSRIIALCDLQFTATCYDCGAEIGIVQWPKGTSKPSAPTYCQKCETAQEARYAEMEAAMS